jgi:hypothetical protein
MLKNAIQLNWLNDRMLASILVAFDNFVSSNSILCVLLVACLFVFAVEIFFHTMVCQTSPFKFKLFFGEGSMSEEFLVKLIKIRMEEFLKHEADYEFKDFILAARKTLGLTRQKVEEYSGIKKAKLFNIENGLYCRKLTPDTLKTLCSLYMIPYEVAQRKLDEHLGKYPIPMVAGDE